MPRATAAAKRLLDPEPTPPSTEGTDAEGFYDATVTELDENTGEPVGSEQVQQTVDNVHQLVPGLPKFERHAVAAQVIRIVGGASLDDPDAPLIKFGDIVQTLGELRCVGISHEENKEGDIVRIIKLRPIRTEIVPFDSTNPDDDGVVRSTPR